MFNDTKENFLVFLCFLFDYCDEIRIVENEDSIFQKNIDKYVSSYIWTRKIPGYNGGNRSKVFKYLTSKELLNEFQKLDSFSHIDIQYEDGGLDISFYKNDKLVFWFLFHEDLYVFEDAYIKAFENYVITCNRVR